ncbi:MAG: hypothetical protein OEV06_01005 [Anaerolineae bacterium]|nr:hypothetical protein [Anaerolineae bacterium]
MASSIIQSMVKKNELDWMLWQVDKSQRQDPPAENLIRAIQHYSQKYGQVPNRCEAPPDWVSAVKPPGGMQVEGSKKVRKHHLMLTLDPELHASDGLGKMLGRIK